MKFIHVADIHASRERLPQTISILNTLTERCKKGDIDFIIFAGDFWDSTITATKGSGFTDILNAVKELEKTTQLLFIYGTPAHEPNGSLDAFRSDRTQVVRNMYTSISVGLKTKIICIPEPRRSDYIADSSEKITQLINNAINLFIESNQRDDKELFDYRIVVYHGEVKGAVYQNGVSASSPTAIPKNLLQSLNADYYALGHIHMPQEVFKNAWYPGSACPKNFGEPHDGCYNLVEIKDGKTKVDRVSFGLPTYVTFYDRPDGFIEGNKGQLKNMNIRFIFDCTKEERKQMNIKAYVDETKERLNCMSVKLEPTVIDVENTERSEVVKHKSITEKMDEYVKEKALIVPKYTRELLKDIEDNTLAKLAYPQHSFELLSLSLRGAIGIRDGQHKEDFELDFEHMEDGVVCLAGPTGHGKSTLLENCHPYPQMLTRDGTLKEHFYLKDSHRILIYKDENGLFYRISILIDGKTVSGKASYYVETSKDRESWNSVSDVDGSLETYKKWVNDTFGSIDVFLRTAFFAKEPTKDATDISATTKAERMELLSKLAGTDHLKEISNIAKELRKDVEKSADKLSTEIDSYSFYEKRIAENNKSRPLLVFKLSQADEKVNKLESDVKDLKIKDAEYQKVKALAEANAKLQDEYKKEYDELEKEFKKFDEAINHTDIFEQIEKNNQIIAENAPEINSLMTECENKEKELNAVKEELALLNKVISGYKIELEKIKADERVYASQIIPINSVCPTCGEPLSEHKQIELEAHNKTFNNSLKTVQRNIETQNELIDRANCQYKEKDNTEKLNDEISSIKSRLADLQSESQTSVEFINNTDEVYRQYTYTDVVEEHQRLTKALEELQKKIDSTVSSDTVIDVSEDLKNAEADLKQANNDSANLKAQIDAADSESKRYGEELEKVADKKAELLELKDKITAYNFIEDAFSNNGIPAIELRESAPEIANITNKILSESYGNKFEIRFGSTSDIKVKRKANEDFNIIVTDTENFDEKTIDLVSSGERIWIKQALFYAFSIVQMNRTGFNFRTRLIDESDGSLDGALRPKYLKMVEAAHKIADSRLTILISHSQEIKDIAQQIIEI